MRYKGHIIRWTAVHSHREGDFRVLDKDVELQVDGVTYTIPAGFCWDGASVPRVFWASFGTPFDEIHELASLFHDAVYAGQIRGVSRKEADKVYRLLIRAFGQRFVKAWLEYAAVRVCGASHWSVKALIAAALLAFAGCQTTLDKTRNATVSGALVDADGEFKAGTVEIQTIAQGETAILVDYSEDSSIFSPGTPMRHIKLTATGVDYVSVMPEIIAHFCEAFKVAKAAKETAPEATSEEYFIPSRGAPLNNAQAWIDAAREVKKED